MQKSKNILFFEGLGTKWWIEIFDEFNKNTIEKLISSEINNFAKKYSRFDKSSYVSKLNSNGYLNNPEIEMIQMINYAKDIYQRTDGIFNIFVGGLLENIGYGDSYANNICNVEWNDIEINENRISIPKNSHIDFGGFGKGWLIDKLSKKLIEYNINKFVINGGGDIYVGNKPCEIILENPINGDIIGSITLQNNALAGSSIKKRAWQKDSQNYHHIIDPITKKSTNNNVAGSFVISDNALIADTLATCLVICPEQKNYLEKKFNSKSLIIFEN